MHTWVIAATALLVASSFHVVPALTRPELFFAVTVAREFPRSPEAQSILVRYRAIVWLGALAALALAIGLGAAPWATVASQPLQLVAALGAFADARRRVLPHAVAPSTVREAELRRRARPLPGGWALQLGPFVLLAVAAARAIGRGPALWSTLAGGVLVCALLAGVALALQRATRSIAVSGEAARAEREFKRMALLVLAGAEYLVAGDVLALVLLGAAPIVSVLALVGTALVLVLAATMARVGQGGSRRVAPASDDGAPVGDRTRDEKWKWGLFYVDRDDPTLLIEKRFGIGYTFNFGNPWAWLILALLLLVALLPLAKD